MKLFLQVDLKKWQDTSYDKPLLRFASLLSDDLIVAEIDNQSDTSVVDLIVRLCSQASTLFLFIQASPDEPIGAVLKLLNHLLREETKIHQVILHGEQADVQRLLASLGERFTRLNDPEIRKFALA
jgi:hypothetical protein